MNLIVDVGYGNTKYIAFKKENDKVKLIKEDIFPTFIIEDKGDYDIVEQGINKSIEYKGKRYIVGDNRLGEPLNTLTPDFIKKYTPLLIKYIKIRENIENIDYVFLTLSAKDLVYAKEIKEELINELNVKKVYIYPQGLGALFLAKATRNLNVVVDIGFNTIDILLFENYKLLKDKVKAIKNGGVIKIAKKVKEYVTMSYDLSLNEVDLAYFLKDKKIKLRFKEIDLSPILEKVKREYTLYLKDLLKKELQRAYYMSDKIILCGGGALFLEDEEFEKIKDPVFANVRGIYKWVKKGF